MAIVKMKHLHLAAMKGDRDALLALLQNMGCVELDEPAQPEPGLTRPEGEGLTAAREGRSAAERALEVLKRYAPEKGNLLAPQPKLGVEELLDPALGEEAARITDEINALDRRMAAIQGERTKKQTELAALAPWLELDMPLEMGSTPQVTVWLGTLPAAVSPEMRTQAVTQGGELAQLTLVSTDRERQYLLLVCHNSQLPQVQEGLKALGWSRVNLRTWTGTAAENTARLNTELAALEQELRSIEEKLSGLGDRRGQIRAQSDRCQARENREENRIRALDTEQVFFLEGWVPEEKWPQLEQALRAYPTAVEVSDPAEDEYERVPVQLKNNFLTRPLNMVTEMYSLPAYGSVDPNPLMAPFFILFYGIMMADMGYGLVMFLLGLLVLKKKKPSGTFGHMAGLMVLCGISTFAMGAITGGFFGDFLTQLFMLLGISDDFALPALFTPLNDTMMILVGAMCLGFVQIVVGMVISFVIKLKHGQVLDAIFEEVTWWLVFAGLGLALLGVTNLVLIAGGVLVVAGPLITGTGLGKLTGIFSSLYNHVTGYFGDILSYSRLMALMLAGSVIAQVFNTLGAIPGNVFIFLVISLVGNTLNFALNLLGCYVHDLRLQCLEYFGKFYQDGGKPFRPLDMGSKYYNIVK